MEKLLYGYAYDLSAVLDIDDYDAYLLEENNTWNCEKLCSINLGRKRILHVTRDTWLILLKENRVLFEKLTFPEKTDLSTEPNRTSHPTIKLANIFTDKDIPCRTHINYRGEIGWKDHPAWKNALNRRSAIFSENGYVFQEYGYLDYEYYNFKMIILKNGWLKINEHDIECISCHFVAESVMSRGMELINEALSKSHNISDRLFAELIKKHGLREMRTWTEIYERDSHMLLRSLLYSHVMDEIE